MINKRTLLELLFCFSFIGCAFAQQNDSVVRSLLLDSVTVTARKPLVKNIGTLQIVEVKGSYLAKMGNLGNMLAITPGMISKGRGSFEVFGKGTPLFYIDDKEVTQTSLLTALQSNNVERIEIEREPGPQYPQGTVAVVKIYTIRPLSDYIALDLSGGATLRRKFSEDASANFRVKLGKLSMGLAYNFSDWKNLNKETYFIEIYNPTAPNAYQLRSDESNHELSKMPSHDIAWSADYLFSKKHRMSFMYYFSHSKSNEHQDEYKTYQTLGKTLEKKTDIFDNSTRNLHNFTLYYTGQLSEKSQLSLSGDYSTIHQNQDASTLEQNLQSLANTSIYTNGKYKYNSITLNGEYSFELPYSIAAMTGARFYNVDNPSDYVTNNPYLALVQSANSLAATDQVTAAFLRLRKKWTKFDVAVGLRYEYADTRLSSWINNEKYTAKRYASNFLPNVNAIYYAPKGWVFQVLYSRSVGRQGYRGLNPFVIYKDTLISTSGNSGLLPSTTDSYRFYTYWKGFRLGLSYFYSKNSITTEDYCDDLQHNRVINQPVNFPESRAYSVDLSYGKTVGKLSFNGMVYVTFPHDKYEFLGNSYVTDKVSCTLNLNASYRFNDMFTAYSNFTYQSARESMYRSQRMANNLTCGLSASLLKDRLSLSLQVTDILHKANYNNVSSRYINTISGTYGTNDIRGISLSVSYSLFNSSINVNASKQNDDVIRRTE